MDDLVEPAEVYREFKSFLADFLIRKAQDEWSADDFVEEKSEYIRLHMEDLLPSLSYTEVMRIGVYFNDMLVFHLTGALDKPTPVSSQMETSLMPISEESDDLQSSQPKRLRNQSASEELSANLASQTNLQEQTSIDTLASMHRRATAPIMQSTPLSVPITTEGGTDLLSYQNRLGLDEENQFTADIISQINLSPIPQASEQRPAEASTRSIPKERAEVSFLRGFAGLVKKADKPRQTRHATTPRVVRERLSVNEPILRQPRDKKKRIDFADLCCLTQKRRTEEQTKKAEESILYFPLMPGKTRNMLKRIINNVVIPEGERGHIPMERIINLSNILRAHASQRQSSIEQPGQMSQLTRSRSPCTPQGMLRSSQILPFTPIRGDISSPSLGMEIDHFVSFPRRSILRQQPLLPIPERDSLIPVPLSPHLEETPFNNFPRCPENLNTGDELGSLLNLPTTISEEIEMIDQQAQSSHGVGSSKSPVVPMQIDDIHSQVDVPQISSNEVIPPMDSQIEDNEVIPPIVPQVQDNDVIPAIVPQVQDHEAIPAMIVPRTEDNVQFSWFEVLRPRADIIYPQVDIGRKRKKRRKRKRRRSQDHDVQPRRTHELSEIPMSPGRNDFPNIPLLPNDFQNQITDVPMPDCSEGRVSGFESYFKLIKEAGRNPEYRTWERFDPYLFNESANFEMYTRIFKRIIKEDFVAMDTLYEAGTSRLEAAKGFKFILELKTMGLIEIAAVGTCIRGFKFKAAD